MNENVFNMKGFDLWQLRTVNPPKPIRYPYAEKKGVGGPLNPAPHESPNPKPPLIPEAPETCRGIPKVGLRAGLLGHFWLGNQHLRKQNDLQETIRCGQFVRERETETETRSNNTHCTANHKTCMVNISHITHHMSYPIFYICMCIYIYVHFCICICICM